MEALMIVIRLVVIANWGWRIAQHPASRERFHQFRNGPQVAAFKRRVAEAQELQRARGQEIGRRIARIWKISGRLLRRKRHQTRALALRRQTWS
jgi:hypothetical protein